MDAVTAAILIVGDEILGGHTQDTNSHGLAVRLRARGVALVRVETIPDDEGEIEATLRRILARDAPGFIFVVGGIGPTPDDRTYEGVRRALEVPLELRPEHVAWARLRAAAKGFTGAAWADPEKSQAAARMLRLPRGSEALLNPVGAALGCVATVGTSRVVVLPGVPRELFAIFDEVFAPRHLMGEGENDSVVEELEVWGSEAALWDVLTTLEGEFPVVRVGSYPQDDRGRIILRIAGEASEAERAMRRLRELVPASMKKARSG